MTCARCGSGVFKAEDQIIMNKVWHKCCFRCTRCNKILDKSTAKLFQGEIFCECCHTIIVEDFESFSAPCRVVSSPSCICIKHQNQYINKTNPLYNYCKKYDPCIPSKLKDTLARNIQSCSCIPDVKSKTYCFAFPIPREVANYYNRAGMRKRNRYSSQKRCYNDDKLCYPPSCEQRPCIRVRTLSPPKKQDSLVRCSSPSPPRCSDRPNCKCCKCAECPRHGRCQCTPGRDCHCCQCKECCLSKMTPRSISPRRRLWKVIYPKKSSKE